MAASADSWGRFLRLFGAIWAGVGSGLAIVFGIVASSIGSAFFMHAAFGGAFAIVGSLLYGIGRLQRAGALDVFRNGTEAAGEVISLGVDRRIRVNNRSPFRVGYSYRDPSGRRIESSVTSWDAPQVLVGERVIVLVDPKRPTRSVMWTGERKATDRVVSEESARADDGVRVQGTLATPASLVGGSTEESGTESLGASRGRNSLA